MDNSSRKGPIPADVRRIGTHLLECYRAAMENSPLMATEFTAQERDYIRRELDIFFSTLPSVAEGFQLKTWRGGSDAGKPKIPPAVKSLMDRGLMQLDLSQRLPRVFFTPAGLMKLKAMMANGRFADPVKFAHVRTELGIDPP